MSQTVLEFEKLTIALPPGADRANAVSDVDLVLRAGKVTCLIGESGSGKSLVARSILGLLPRPHVRIGSGRILFEGQDLAVAPQDKMRSIRGAKIGMIFQEPMTALNPLHTIGRQLDEVLRIHTSLGKAASRTRVPELLDSVHLPEPSRIIRSFPHQLSGGQRQRAMIAMALLLNPRLLIADEPTTALDVTTQAQILYLIRELQREHGTSVLFITHDFGVVADIADEVAVLQRGNLVERGTAGAVLGAPSHPYTKCLDRRGAKARAASGAAGEYATVHRRGARYQQDLWHARPVCRTCHAGAGRRDDGTAPRRDARPRRGKRLRQEHDGARDHAAATDRRRRNTAWRRGYRQALAAPAPPGPQARANGVSGSLRFARSAPAHHRHYRGGPHHPRHPARQSSRRSASAAWPRRARRLRRTTFSARVQRRPGPAH